MAKNKVRAIKPQEFVQIVDEMKLSVAPGVGIKTKEEIIDNDKLTDEIQRMRAACDIGGFAGLHRYAFALAHHQVNEKHLAFFVLNRMVAAQFFDKVAVIINPRILSYEGEITELREGCMSHPYRDERKVRRHSQVKVEYYNLKWEKIEKTLTGIAARIFQHETDHVNGKTIWADKTYLKAQ